VIKPLPQINGGVAEVITAGGFGFATTGIGPAVHLQPLGSVTVTE
jgi:hypothetical protein